MGGGVSGGGLAGAMPMAQQMGPQMGQQVADGRFDASSTSLSRGMQMSMASTMQRQPAAQARPGYNGTPAQAAPSAPYQPAMPLGFSSTGACSLPHVPALLSGTTAAGFGGGDAGMGGSLD